ncbi:MAG: hypothetical protein P8K81_01050 [Flavobacteriales bacterium]|nr:hypothetical protein [Flavobacteriales bacterium]
MRNSNNQRSIFGTICGVMALSVALLACQKEDIDELIILEEGEHETIVVVPPFDCELLQLNVGDSCIQEQAGAIVTGFVSQDCECVVNEPCGMTVDISSSPDDGTGNGMLESSTIGGIGPYSYAWYRSGALVGSDPSLTALDFGVYQLIVHDSEGCSIAAMAAVELNLSGWDCPELLGDVGDACSLNESTEGLVTSNCECATTADCSITVTFVSSEADDGSGSGSASIFVDGGQGPYIWTLLSPDWTALEDGILSESTGLLEINGLNSGFFGIEFTDSQGCLAQVLINIP